MAGFGVDVEGSVPDRDKFNVELRSNATFEADTQRFEQWLLENGAEFPQLEIKSYDDEVRGVHAVEDIGEDVTVIKIPLKCLITVEMGKDTEIGQKVLASRLELDAPKHVFIMLFMLVDMRNPNSFFRPYYDILPKTLSNMPIFWTTEEVRLLDGSYLQTQIDNRRQAIVEDYHAICEIAPELKSTASLEQFMWARMCVCSRNFGLIVNGLRTSAMVPHADMLNHYRPRETKWTFDNGLQAFTITTLTNIRAGAQIYDSYGQCNHRFLLNYGFAVENNAEADGFCPNEVSMPFELSRNDPLFERKDTLFLRDGSSGQRRLRLCVSWNENTRWALSLLRIISSDALEFEQMLMEQPYAYKTTKNVLQPVSVANELRAMELLLTTVKSMQEAYPRSLEEDVQMLASGELKPFSNERHACIQVKGEKEVLRFFEDLSTTAVRALRGELDAMLPTIYEDKSTYIADYVSRVLRPLVQSPPNAFRSPTAPVVTSGSQSTMNDGVVIV